MSAIVEVFVQSDSYTEAVSKALDYKFEGRSFFEGWNKPQVPAHFGIGLILGPSGSGKSLLLKEFGTEEQILWDPQKAIVSHFESPEDAVNRLMAVGLNSIPAWCRPFHVLSNGEQFRAGLARKIKSGAVIDEFTSVVDRNVAKAASVALRRYVANNDLENIVLASCHSDILEWLRPDWYFDTATGTLHDGRSLQRPKIEIRIYPCKRSTWKMFARHHYLTQKLNSSCHSYLATATFGTDRQETIVGFVSAISQPMRKNQSGRTKKAYREHRTIVLPDFQGLGIGPRISDAVAQLYLDLNTRYFSRTVHIRFGSYRDRLNSGWVPTCKNRKTRDDLRDKPRRTTKSGVPRTSRWLDFKGDTKRVCFSHEYLGESNV